MGSGVRIHAPATGGTRRWTRLDREHTRATEDGAVLAPDTAGFGTTLTEEMVLEYRLTA